jgi:hypothetical protein
MLKVLMSFAHQFTSIISTGSISRLKPSTILLLFSFAIYLVVLKFKICKCPVLVTSCSSSSSFVNILKSFFAVVKVVSIVLALDWSK